jgi:hypothetical protein
LPGPARSQPHTGFKGAWARAQRNEIRFFFELGSIQPRKLCLPSPPSRPVPGALRVLTFRPHARPRPPPLVLVRARRRGEVCRRRRARHSWSLSNPMGDPHLLSSAHPNAAASASARKHPGPIDERLAASDPSPSSAKRPRVAAEPPASGGCVPNVEADVRALVSMAGGIYPLARAEALRGLTAVLENVDPSSRASVGITECCYKCAVELMRDDDNGVRLAVVRLVRFCRFVSILLHLDASGA